MDRREGRRKRGESAESKGGREGGREAETLFEAKVGEELWPTFNLRQGENTILPAPWVKVPSLVHQRKTERVSPCCPLRASV